MLHLLDRLRNRSITPLHATIISFLVAMGTTLILVIIGVGFRDTIGLYLVVGVIGLSLTLATSLRPELGVYLLMITVFSNLSSVFTDNGLPGINKPLIGLIILSVAANSLMKQSLDLKLKGVEWWMLAYGGSLLASYFGATDRDEAFSMFFDYMKDYIIVICIVYALRSAEYWKRSVWLVIITMTIVAALTAYQVLTGDYDQTFWGLATIKRDQIITNVWQMRLNGPVYDPNFYGLILVMALPLVVYRIIDEKSWIIVLLGVVAALVNILANLNTYSRGSFLTMAVVLFFIALERKVNIGLLFLVFLSVLMIMPFLPEGYTERLETLQVFSSEKDSSEVLKESSFRGRTSEILSGFHMFLDHPFVGIGAGNYEVRYQEYASRVGLETRTELRQAHSLVIETIAETGLFGITTFIGIFGTLFLGLFRAKRILKKHPVYAKMVVWIVSLEFAMIGYLLCSAVFLHGDLLRYLWMLVALGTAMIHFADNLSSKQYEQDFAYAKASA